MPKNLSDQVLNTIVSYQKNGQLLLPKNYSAENALKSAYLILQETKDKDDKRALDVCEKSTIANALLDMIIMGLNPGKKQCYFIVYGKALTMMPSYFGKITALKRIEGVEDINAQVIYKGDKIAYTINTDGSISNIKHEQEFENIDDNNIVGGYCVIIFKGKEKGVISTMAQIQESWNMSKFAKTKKEYRTEFVKRTMVSKAIKWFVNTRDDQDLLIETMNKNESEDYDYNDEIIPEKNVIIDPQEPAAEAPRSGKIIEAKEEKQDAEANIPKFE